MEVLGTSLLIFLVIIFGISAIANAYESSSKKENHND
jgi:hypothetical protein